MSAWGGGGDSTLLSFFMDLCIRVGCSAPFVIRPLVCTIVKFATCKISILSPASVAEQTTMTDFPIKPVHGNVHPAWTEISRDTNTI